MDIIEALERRLAGSALRVAFVEYDDARILEAARYLVDHDICQPVLVGPASQVVASADVAHVALDGIAVFDTSSQERVDEVARAYAAANDGMSERRALRKAGDPLAFVAMLTATGSADCMAAGVTYSTGDVIVAAQRYIGLDPGVSLVSSIGYQVVTLGGAQRVLGLADCAVCTDPSPEQLASIALASARSYAGVFGEEPRVAMLSYSTKGSGVGGSVDAVTSATALVREREPRLAVDGELQLDAALVPEVAARKVGEDSAVAGRANVLVFPDLNSGNIAVKCMQLFDGGESFGPMLQGFRLPVTDFSRSARTRDVVGNVILCLLAARGSERR